MNLVRVVATRKLARISTLKAASRRSHRCSRSATLSTARLRTSLAGFESPEFQPKVAIAGRAECRNTGSMHAARPLWKFLPHAKIWAPATGANQFDGVSIDLTLLEIVPAHVSPCAQSIPSRVTLPYLNGGA